jgi:hypothetical protein
MGKAQDITELFPKAENNLTILVPWPGDDHAH